MVALLKSQMEQIRLDPPTRQACRFSVFPCTRYAENGILKWKIQKFTSRKHEAYGGQHTPIYSWPFYISSTARYKVCICLYVNGYGDGRIRTCLSTLSLWKENMTTTSSGRLLNMESDCDVFVKFDPDPLCRPLKLIK